MPTVVGVRFKDSGKTYHFDPQNMSFACGDWVIVETVRGPEVGRIATPPAFLEEDQLFGELKPVLRSVTQQDFDQWRRLQRHEPEVLQTCVQKVAEHQLPMHLVKAEYNFDGSRLTFFFTADRRVDFRALVRDLARTFRTRIELRQIGPRDEAKLLGGIGPCGRLLCCATFLPDYARVSIKMAKDQDLPLNPTKISGVCGRLLCCLSYEQEQYLQIKAELPQRGAWVQTPYGPGEVVAVNVVKETVTVELTDANTVDCTAAQILEVVQRVASEAQARNAEGITPVARERLGAQPVPVPGELVADDPDLLRSLEELEDVSERPVAGWQKPEAGSQRFKVRPEAALGGALTRKSRGAQPVPQAEPMPEEVDEAKTSEAHADPASRRRSRRRRKRQADKPTVAMQQAVAPALSEQPPGQPAKPASQKTNNRRRKRQRGRNGKQ